MVAFWILWTFNALVSLVPVYFFFDGLSDGTVNSENFFLWMLLLLVVVAVLGGTYWLKSKNHVMAAKVLLAVAAIPGLLAIAFISIAIFGDVRWN